MCRQTAAVVIGPAVLAGPVSGQALKEGNAVEAPRLAPGEQQAAFALPDGFSIELVASEEQGVEKPVALHFDAAARLWTMTATEYPLDTNDPQQAEVARRKWRDGGRDRVLVIDEPLAPGPHVPRVFADGLVMPMSVLPVGDGAMVAHGPEMLRLRDTDGDGRADRRDVLLRGFGVQDSHTMAHQLMWLPDGSVLTVQGVLDSGGVTDADGKTTAFNYGKFASFRPDGTGFRLIGAGLNNTWGVLLQRNGRMWVQEANSFDHSIAPFEEGVHFHGWNEEPFLKDAPWQPGVGEIDLGSTGLSGLAQSEDRAGGFPPDWQRRMLIANAVTGAINSVTAEPRPEGGWMVTRGPDLVTCADRRFRPVHLAFGPDACLYIVDWYNPVISHNEVPRDHPARDKSSGRIWRVRHATQTARTAPNVAAASDSALIAHLRSPNTWEARAAWRQIVDRQAIALVPSLLALAGDAAAPDDARIHAVWCLAGLRRFEASVWTSTMPGASPELAFELVRALRSAPVPAGDARPFPLVAAARPELRVRRELARYFQSAREVDARDLAAVLRAYAPVARETIKGVQGETLPWPAYEQAFLNHQLERVVELQEKAVEALAAAPSLMASLPDPVRVLVGRRGAAKRFEDGSITAAELADAHLRSIAYACVASSPKAAAVLRAFIETSAQPWDLAREILDSSTLTGADLRAFTGPLALRMLVAPEPERWGSALDLVAHACGADDSPVFAARARAMVARQPDLLLPAIRAALSAGIRDVAFFSEIAESESAPPAARAAAWTGWFESAGADERPGLEARLRAWAAGLPAGVQTEVLTELAATTTGAHFALNNVFPALLAQDAATLPRLADELAERVPGHGRLTEVQAVVQRQRAAHTEAAEKRRTALTLALAGGRLTADPAAGQPLFTGLCLNCHSAGGQGVGFAPPLDGSRQRDPSAVLTALLEPEAAVENVFRPFHVRLRDGTSLEGFLKSRDGPHATIQSMGGAMVRVNLLRAHTARHLNGHSLMPALATGLTDQQLADLVAYVRSLE